MNIWIALIIIAFSFVINPILGVFVMFCLIGWGICSIIASCLLSGTQRTEQEKTEKQKSEIENLLEEDKEKAEWEQQPWLVCNKSWFNQMFTKNQELYKSANISEKEYMHRHKIKRLEDRLPFDMNICKLNSYNRLVKKELRQKQEESE